MARVGVVGGTVVWWRFLVVVVVVVGRLAFHVSRLICKWTL